MNAAAVSDMSKQLSPPKSLTQIRLGGALCAYCDKGPRLCLYLPTCKPAFGLIVETIALTRPRSTKFLSTFSVDTMSQLLRILPSLRRGRRNRYLLHRTAIPTLGCLWQVQGAPRGFSPELEELSRKLGESLASARCGLVTGGWPGVDEWVARSFAETAYKLQTPLEDALIQVIVRTAEPAFAAGQLVFVKKGAEEWDEPIRRAGVVLLLGGLGGTEETGQRALRMRKPVLPIADTGGDAKAVYIQMLKKWPTLNWMGLTAKEFQRLGRPKFLAIDAAVELAQKAQSAP